MGGTVNGWKQKQCRVSHYSFHPRWECGVCAGCGQERRTICHLGVQEQNGVFLWALYRQPFQSYKRFMPAGNGRSAMPGTE